MDVIRSKDNKLIKNIRALQGKKGRAVARAFVVEGVKFVAEIPDGWDVRHVVVSEGSRGMFPAFGTVPGRWLMTVCFLC